MNYLRNCRTCGGPVFGSWLYSYHDCKPTPYQIVYQAPRPALPAPKPLLEDISMDHDITPGEATRLCSRIAEQIDKHYKSCKWCALAEKLKMKKSPCEDGMALQDALNHWEQHTLIGVDRKP